MAVLSYDKLTRSLSIRGKITTTTGEEILLDGNNVVSYSISESAGSNGISLGSTESATFSLSLMNSEDREYTPAVLDSGRVQVEIGLMDEDTGVITYSPAGVWYITDADMQEQSQTVDVAGLDALGVMYGAEYADSKAVYPQSIGALLRSVMPSGQVLVSSSFPNSSVSISKMPEWDTGVTRRDIVGYIAACAGGFARIDRRGRLEIRSWKDGLEYSVDPNNYMSSGLSGGNDFEFNTLQVLFNGSDDYVRIPIDPTLTDNPTNTIQVDNNPLYTQTIAQSVVNELRGITATSATTMWVGDPALSLGDRLILTNTHGETVSLLVCMQSLSFDGGLSGAVSCSLPSATTTSSDGYSTGSIMDANGNIVANRIPGFSQSVIYATTGYIGDLTSETITTDALTANIIKALNLTADVATIEKIKATVLQAQSITSDLIAAGTITTDKLNTADLQATVATIASATIANANIDFAKIKIADIGTGSLDNLIVRDQSNMDKVWIDRLKVRNAQLVTATVDELIVKASDGKYYRLDIGTNGAIVPTNITTTLTDSEITAGITADGHKTIIETDITVDDLATSSFRATTALIDKITTDRLNADVLFANEAFIGKLQTSEIYAGKSLSVLIGDMYDDDGKIGNMMRYDEDGLHVGAKDYSTEVLIDEDSVNIKNSGTMKSEFADRYIQFGNYQLRMSADGGLVFKVKE